MYLKGIKDSYIKLTSKSISVNNYNNSLKLKRSSMLNVSNFSKKQLKIIGYFDSY